MKQKLFFLFVLFLPFLSTSQTITVKQDGTGDFATIQAAVDSANNGDTVLVWPGTYYENVQITGKNIILGSLTITTGDESYLYQTIIDGDNNGSCIKIWNWDNLEEIIINGFTIMHGSGANCGGVCGGGLFVEYTKLIVNNCLVKNNRCKAYGAGIYLFRADAFLSNVTITNNCTYDQGGGILAWKSTLTFDSINRCNIYENYAAVGVDIFKSFDSEISKVYLDTFTVQNPDYYYIYYSVDNSGAPQHNINYDILHAKIQQDSTDLYVAPWGVNTNNGLTPDQPLKTISYALLKAASDSVSPDTIHVANGTYSETLTGEHYPLSLKSYVIIKGESRDSTMLNGEHKIYLAYGNFAKYFNLERLTIRNGKSSVHDYGAIIVVYSPNAKLSNILFTNNNGTLISAVNVFNSSHFKFDQVEFYHNIGGESVRTSFGTGNIFSNSDTIIFNNCIFRENIPDYTISDKAFGGGLSVTSGEFFTPNTMIDYLNNCLFYDNHTAAYYNVPGANSVIAFDAGKAFVTNSTFSDNTSDNVYGANIAVVDKYSSITVYNSIFYNNQPAEFFMKTNEGSCDLNVYHSLVDGGEANIRLLGGNTILYYDTTNIDTDPLFYGGPDFPYNLSDESPCIDAGTLDLPQFVLDHMPDVDLAGNPRVVNDKIDMGCYEWNPTVGTDEHRVSNTEHRTPNLKAFPNPFSTTTYIAAQWETAVRVNIEFYNNAGLLVKTLQSGKQLPGSCQIPWNGTDSNGNYLPSGVYVLVLRIDGIETESVKVVKK